MLSWKGLFVVYFYSRKAQFKDDVAYLEKSDLLLPPTITNSGAWTRGYFETVEQRKLDSKDVLAVHCFWSEAFGLYKDEYGNELKRRYEPCGLYAVDSYYTIDHAISKACGILYSPPVPALLVGKPRSVYKQRLKVLQSIGVSREHAEVEAMKASIRHEGDRVENYAWPETGRGVIVPPHSLPPPDPKELSGGAYRAFEGLLASGLSKGLARPRAEIEALKALVREWGESINDYCWPDDS
jgi:hypothetical protein